MLKISSAEFQNQLDHYQDAARAEPVIVTLNDCDSLVVISADEYRRLKRRDRQVLTAEQFTDADIAAIKASKPSRGAARFDDEVE